MRILTLTNLYPNPFHPNRATFNRQHIKIMAQQHAVRVISPIAWTDELAARWRGKPALPPGRRVIFDGIEVDHPRYLFTPRIFRSRYGQFYLRSVKKSFARALREFRPDLIYAPWAYPDGWAAVQLGREAGLPVIVKVHGSDVLLLSKTPDRRQATAEALSSANAVIAVSRDLAKHVVALGASPDRVRVVYDAVNPAVFYPGDRSEARSRLGLPAEEPILLFIGNLVPVKGIDVLIDACSLLAKEGLPFRVYLIGEGPLRRSLEKQVLRAGLQDRVRFMGSLPHADLPDWYRAASLFVLASHSEGVPNVLLESVACGTPFVASNVGGIAEIPQTGSSLLVPAGDAVQLASAVRVSLAKGSGREPQDRVRTKCRKESVAESLAIFAEVIAEHAKGRSGASAKSVSVSC